MAKKFLNKKIIITTLICFLLVSCNTQSNYEKYIERVSNSKFYGNPEKINIYPKINIDFNRKIFLENLNLNVTVKEATDMGDLLIQEYLGANYDNFLRRLYMYKAYEKNQLSNQNIKISNAKFENEINILGQYKFNDGKVELSKNAKIEENDKVKMERVVNLLNKIFPKEQLNQITEIELINDDKLDSPMYVLYSGNKSGMKLGLNLVILEDSYYKNDENLIYSLIHEFAHVFSMDKTQLLGNDVINNPKYIWELLEGYRDDSYLKKFYNTFWKTVPIGWTTTKYKSQKEMVDFYLLNDEVFSNGYASTNVHEDFAESFKFFITEKVNFDSEYVLEKKVIFFYQFPELVELRLKILNNINKLKN